MLNRMELEERIQKWNEPEQFIAREIYSLKENCPACTKDLLNIKKRLNKVEAKLLVILLASAFGGGMAGSSISRWLGN